MLRTGLILFLAFIPCLGGCRRSLAERKMLEAPPYTIQSPGQLLVRPDLFALLTFRDATSANSQAAVRGFGRVAFAPNSVYAVRSSVPGFVERVYVSVGQQVRAKQVLASIRSSEIARLRAEARRMESSIATDEDVVARLEKLIEEGAASPRELVEAKGRLSGARAEYAGVREALSAAGALGGSGERFDLRASAAGRVLVRRLAPGERIDPGATEPPFLVGDPKQLVIRGAFPERDVPFLKEGGACRYQVPTLGVAQFTGKLTNVVRTVDAKTHTAEAICLPDVADARLSADMTAKVEALVASEGAVTVPRSAVLLRRDDRVVFVKSGENLLQRRPVQVGAAIGDEVQILDGLKAGELVAVKNAVLLDGELDQVL